MMSFDIDHMKETLKGDFEKMKSLDDLKDFLLELLPKMMETDIKAYSSALEMLQQLRAVIEEVNENDK